MPFKLNNNTPKKAYIQFAQQHDIPLFFKVDWLNAMTIHWDVIQIDYATETYYFVYIFDKKWTFTFIRNLQPTPYCGLIAQPKSIRTLSSEVYFQLIDFAIQNLPRYDQLYVDMYPLLEIADNFAYYNDTFKLKRTSILSLEATNLFENYKPSLQRQIKKAKKYLHITFEENLQPLITLYQNIFTKQGVKAPIHEQTMKHLYKCMQQMNCGKIMYATDNQGSYYAGLMMLYDETTAYYILGGSDTEKNNSGAMSFLMHEAIHFAQDLGKVFFDFEGSMHDGIHRFFMNFNPTEKYYLSIQHTPNLVLKLLGK